MIDFMFYEKRIVYANNLKFFKSKNIVSIVLILSIKFPDHSLVLGVKNTETWEFFSPLDIQLLVV